MTNIDQLVQAVKDVDQAGELRWETTSEDGTKKVVTLHVEIRRPVQGLAGIVWKALRGVA